MYKIQTEFPKPLMSKTSYVKYMQHWKIVWLDFHKRDERREVSDMEEILFATGNEIGQLATTHFTDKPIEFKRKGIQKDLKETEEALSLATDNKGNLKHFDYREELPEGYEWVYNTFFEPCLISEHGFYAYVDILLRTDKGFSIYEVKSTSKVKTPHIHDITFQAMILKYNNIKIDGLYVSHINKLYKRGKRKPLKWAGLFRHEDVKERVANYLKYKGDAKLAFRSWDVYYGFIKKELGKEYEIAFRDYHRIISKKGKVSLKNILKRKGLSTRKEVLDIKDRGFKVKEQFYKQTEDQYWNRVRNIVLNLKEMKEEPYAPLGSWVKYPYMTEYFDYLTKDLPPHHIYFLGMAKNRGIKSYHKEELQNEGITSQLQIDRKIMNRYSFSDTQLREIRENKRAYALQQKKKGASIKVKEHGVWNNPKGFFKDYANLQFPLNYLDFETYSPVLPLAEGHSPHQRLVYQYSLHIQKNKNYRSLEHHEFLYDPTQKNKDPERELAEHLVNSVPKTGSVIVYYKHFEKSVIRNLADRFEDLREPLMSIYKRIWDLYAPFERRDHYNALQKGSASIKKVYPLFQEKLGVKYEDLNISNGLEATMAYGEVLEGKRKLKGEAEYSQFMFDMLEYCKLDTYAMVILLNKISERLKIPLTGKKFVNNKKKYAMENLLDRTEEIFKDINREMDYNESKKEYEASLKVAVEEIRGLYEDLSSNPKTLSYVKYNLKRNHKGIKTTKIDEVRKIANKVPKIRPILNELIVNSAYTTMKEIVKKLDVEKIHYSTKKSQLTKAEKLVSGLNPKLKKRVLNELIKNPYEIKNNDKYINELFSINGLRTFSRLIAS